ncbi:SIMPL domain-containing protein [Candidatus Pacearchaeota archaeon]|nr:SIMPL domain-containing protein [Candidatus Pacearchaeota archaeon]
MKIDNKTIVAGLVIAIILIAGFIYISSTSATVAAQGNSVLTASPDEVSVNLMIEARNKTAQGAKEMHDKILEKLTLELLRAGIDKNDIKTVNFNIYPEYIWKDGKNEQIGYIARQDIIIETKNFDAVANIIDVSIDAGALVSYINFELSDEKQSEYKTQALEKAGKDARAKAEATASGLGKKLGRLVSVQSEEFNYIPYRYFDAAAAEGAEGSAIKAREAAINLAPRDIDVTATIRVEYKLRNF